MTEIDIEKFAKGQQAAQYVADSVAVSLSEIIATEPEITSRPKPEADTDSIKRMTIIISEGLHRRIKIDCATRGISMLDAVRDALEHRWPEAA
jgi:hypothetical protein